MRRSKQMQNKRRRLQSNTSGGERKATPGFGERRGSDQFLELQKGATMIIRSSKKTFKLKQEAAYRRKGEK